MLISTGRTARELIQPGWPKDSQRRGWRRFLLGLFQFSYCEFYAKPLIFHHQLLHPFLKWRQHIPYLLLSKPPCDVLLAIPIKRLPETITALIS